MRTSPEIDQISAALALAQSEIEIAPKDSVNPHFKSKFANLTAIWEACRPALSKNGLSVIQSPSVTDNRLVRMTSRILHKSGQWIEGDLDLKPAQDTPQAIGSAITYGRRYSLSALLGVISEEDDDGNAASAKSTYSQPKIYAGYSNEEKQIAMAIMSKHGIKTEEMATLNKSLLGKPIETLDTLVRNYMKDSVNREDHE